jgi:CUE domain
MASPHSAMTSPAQLDFAQAMTDFKIMFPGMDSDVIEAVLRSNNGAVDATIDQLLTMTADNEAGAGQQQQQQLLMDTPPPEYSTNNLPSYQQALR